MKRSFLLGVLVVGWVASFGEPAVAWVVESTAGTTSAPADDPGWSNASLSNSPNYIYLGDGWALTARHAAFGTTETVSFSTGNFGVIPNQNYVVPNPVGMGLSAQTDLRLVRLNGDPGLPSIFDGSADFTIATQQVTTATPESQRQVLFMGHGRSREETQTHWNVDDINAQSPVWTESASGVYTGYKGLSDNTKRWGTNQITDEDNVFGGSDADLRTNIKLKTGDGITRDVMSMATKFDANGLTNEAQGLPGDSGSAVFYKRNGQWELIGIVNAVFTYPNQPTMAAIYGNVTTFADLSFYRGEIFNVINGHTSYSVMGDINLDGVVNGTGSGPAASDDVSAFVAGWLYQQSDGDITSWKKGDLNLDGTTDAADFLMLRNALNGTGAGGDQLSLSGLLGSVPEPSALALLAMGAAAAGSMRLLRRRFVA